VLVDLIADMLVDEDNCQPRPLTVPIEQETTEPGVIIFPQCTRVNRCGGCCGHDALECVPTRVQRVNVKVSVCVLETTDCIPYVLQLDKTKFLRPRPRPLLTRPRP